MSSDYWFVPCTWVIWVIWQCLQWVIWWLRRQGIRQNFDILSCYMDTFLFLLRVLLRLWRLLIFRDLLILIHISAHFNLLLSFFCFFSCFPNSFVFSLSYFLTLKIFLFLMSPPHCIIMTQYVFQYEPSLVYHATRKRRLWILVFPGWDRRSCLQLAILKSSSVQDSFKKRTW